MLIEETNKNTAAEGHWEKTAESNHIYFKDVLPQNGRQEMCYAGEEVLYMFPQENKNYGFLPI